MISDIREKTAYLKNNTEEGMKEKKVNKDYDK